MVKETNNSGDRNNTRKLSGKINHYIGGNITK